ncbi:GNAT family N-acetyltransferase [Nocardioides marmorisolisilvae]|uniref:GNAT family N-acetyltransferase n=1 Tax=Nocardioides marmorisolisilvae TaxID=1542737 RepID=A0A3N0DXP8_9ACTN|nr:GNAT family N-acetyltransferase [Nocardioides marmorisolisilvae]
MVGQRVVVRRVLPGETGPSGGPAMTDLLGICESWSDGIAVIRTEDGTRVEIATADIVSGKPVPPRPPVRARISTREAESHAAVLWAGVDREPLGEWELRSVPVPHGRLLKRTNSCLAIGDPGSAFTEAVDSVRTWYADRERPAQVQVEVGSEIEQAFLDSGWQPLPDGEAAFWMGSVSRALRSSSDAAALGEVSVDGPRLVVRTAGAVVRGGIDGDWVGVHGLHVDPELRRQGLGLAVVRTLLDAAAERGALTVWLHVETANEPAQQLYESLGLTEHHRCRYLRSPS